MIGRTKDRDEHGGLAQVCSEITVAWSGRRGDAVMFGKPGQGHTAEQKT